MDNKFCVWELKRKQKEPAHVETVVLRRGITAIGRGLLNQVHCPSTLASRNHCQIKLLDNGLIFIKDLKSLNGVYLAADKILPERDISLSNGDAIGIGVETTDVETLDNVEMCIFHLTRKVLSKDEVEARRGENCVVPLNGLSCEDSSSSNHSVTDKKTDHDCAKVVTPEPSISMNQTNLDTKDDGSALACVGVGNENIVEGGLSKGVESENDAEHGKTDSPVEVDRQFFTHFINDHSQPPSSCVGNQTLDNDSNRKTNQGVCHEGTATLIELDNIDHELRIVGDAIKLGKHDLSTNKSSNTISMHADSNITHFNSKDQTAEVTNDVTKNNFNDTNVVAKNNQNDDLPAKKLLNNKNPIINDDDDSKSTNFSGEFLTTGKNEITITNASTVEHLKKDKGETVSNEQTNKNGSVGSIKEQPFFSGPQKDTSEIDSTVISIFKRRLSQNSSSIENENHSLTNVNPAETKNSTSPVPEPSIANDWTSLIDCDEQDSSSNKFDEIQKSQISGKNTMSNSTDQVKSSLSESFTIDDDIIIIDDDDLLPCSQMFDVKYELKDDTVEDSDIPFIDIIDEDEISDADSSDEWFLRLSQCDPSNIKSFEDDDLISENKSIDICKNEFKESNALEREFKSEDEDTIYPIPLEINIRDVTPVEEIEPEHRIVDNNCVSGEKFEKTSLGHEETFFDNFPNTSSESPNSKNKRKHESSELISAGLTTINHLDDEHLFSKKIKQTHPNNVPSPAAVEDIYSNRRNLQKCSTSKNDKLHSQARRKIDIKSKCSTNKQDGNQSVLKSSGDPLDNRQHPNNNKVAIKHDEFVDMHYSDCEHESDARHTVQNAESRKPTTDRVKPAWKYCINEMVMISNNWDANEEYLNTRVVDNHESIITDTSKLLKVNDDNVQRQDNLELTADMKSLTVSNDLNTIKSRETTQISNETSEKVKLVSKNYSSSSEMKKLTDSSSHLHSVQETKMDAIQKKISEKYAKKPTPVVGAKALPIKKRRLFSPNHTLNQNGEFSHNEGKVSKSKSRLSKGVQHKSKAPLLSADEKAYRKSKLSEIASKTNKEQTNITEKKLVNTNKTVKNTQKNRTEMFLDHLVLPDNKSAKEKKSADDNVDSKQKSSILQYKIPKRNVQHEKMETETSSNGAENKQFDQTMSAVNDRDLVKTVTSNEVKNLIKPKTNKIDLSNKETNTSHKVNACNVTPCQKTDTTSKALTGKPNKLPHSGLEYELNYNIQQSKSAVGHLKSIIKVPDSRPSNGKRKRVKFNHADVDSVIVHIRYIDVAEGSTLNKVTPHIAKKDTPPQRKDCTSANQVPSFNYFYEILHYICKWNTVWFKEKDKCKGEPPAFTGQIFHIQDSFISFSDYRRSVFPLMLHELWAVLARQHDQIQNRNNPFIIDIQQISTKPVTHIFPPILKEGEKKTLCRLDCQILLEKSNQPMWPRASDLVVLDVRISLKGISIKHRILGFIFSCNVRPISSRSIISPKLKAQNPNASLVMDISMFIKEERHKIDTTQESRVAVLKNIRPEMRLFNALDNLATSPMLKVICEPSMKNLEIPLFVMDKSTYNMLDHLNTSQKKAVTNVASACLTNNHMIHFIHGPPGCGKSEVIISIIKTLFLNHVKKKLPERLQILLCAPSNAAIDDIFLRLMELRNKYKKSVLEIKMVRIGKTDFTHNNVRSMTLDYLVDKKLKASKDILEDEQSRLIELKTLEAKRNQLSYQLENLGSKKNDATYIRNVEMKLANTIKSMKELETGKGKKAYQGKELREKTKETELIYLGGANVIASTLSSCFNPQMETAYLKNKLRVSCCIVDEATQCTEPELLIPLMLGVRQLVLVGDPLQLPATVISSTAKEHGLDRSLFARHRDWWLRNSPDGLPTSRYHFLDTQYRMHPDIAKWPSQHFYNSSIKNHDSVEARGSSHPLLPYVILSHGFAQSNHEESNYEEATLVERLVQAINGSGLCKDKSIAVITPYNRQRVLLRRKLHPDVEIGTVDSFQGRERDIVIMSCVRTEGVGFMSGTERLNVALTRARYSLIICGNFKSLQADVTWASLLQDAKLRGIFKTVPTSYRPDNLCHAVFKAR